MRTSAPRSNRLLISCPDRWRMPEVVEVARGHSDRCVRSEEKSWRFPFSRPADGIDVEVVIEPRHRLMVNEFFEARELPGVAVSAIELDDREFAPGRGLETSLRSLADSVVARCRCRALFTAGRRQIPPLGGLFKSP